MKRLGLIAAFAAIGMLPGGQATAADPEVEQLREQLRATVLQLRELQDQQAAAPAPAQAGPDTAALKAKLDASEAALRAARRNAAASAALKADLTKAQADSTAQAAAAQAAAGERDKYKAALDQSNEAGRQLTLERDRLRVQLNQAVNIATACQAKNTRLVAFAENLLNDYRKVGIGQVLAAHEPVFGLRRVQLENIAQDREDAVRANKCDARLDVQGPAKAPPGG
jgi:hypothetical protein